MIPTIVLERFPVGQVMITQGAFAELAWEDVSRRPRSPHLGRLG